MKQKSAKDLAFDRERLKFRQEIQDLKHEVTYWKAEANKNLEIANHYESIISVLETQIGIPKEELLEHIARSKKINETLLPLLNFTRGVY